jgi:DNA-binding beta-propeller fold protein YncE
MFTTPRGIAISPDGLFALILEGNIRRLVITTATVTTLAGGSGGSANGIGTNAQFNSPYDIRISSDGLFAVVADYTNAAIRHIVITTATVTTLAGSSGGGLTNGVGTSAQFSFLPGVDLSPNDQFILVADSLNMVIRHVALPTAAVSTYAGHGDSGGLVDGVGIASKFNFPRGLSLSPDGIYALIADRYLIRHLVLSTLTVTTFAGVTSTGSTNGIGTFAKFKTPFGVSISPDGLIALVADYGNNMVRHIVITTVSVTTLAGSGSFGSTNGIGTNALFTLVRGVTISPNGLYALIADGNNLVRHIVLSTASVTTLAGSGLGSTNGIGTVAKFSSPASIAISPDGLFALVADTSNHRIRHIVISTVNVTTLAGAGTVGPSNGVGTNAEVDNPSGVSISPDGLFALVTSFNSQTIRLIDISSAEVSIFAGQWAVGAINGKGTNAKFYSPYGVSIAPDGTFALVSEYGNNIIRRLSVEELTGAPTLVPSLSPSLLPTTLPTLGPSQPPNAAPPPSPQPPSAQPPSPQPPSLQAPSPSLRPSSAQPTLDTALGDDGDDDDDNNQQKTAIIIGVSVGGAAVLLAGAAATSFHLLKRIRRKKIFAHH